MKDGLTPQSDMSPQAQAPAIIEKPNPEWLRIAEACEFARVSKPVIYDWMNKGWIKNVSLRQRGQIKGVRLVSFDSLRAFLESRATGGDA
jgi:hypothetical protein